MDRREFVKHSSFAAAGSLLPSSVAVAESAQPVKPEYIRKDFPPFEVAPCRGVRYTDLVPDTLEIAERARLGINCLTGTTDSAADHEIYWWVDFYRNPPTMKHDYNDWCQNVEGMMESLALLRIASGSEQNSHVDRVWMEVLLKS